MVPSDWDLAPKCFCGPNFISYLIGESLILSATRSVSLKMRPNSPLATINVG